MSNVVNNLLINGASGVTVGGTGTAIKYFPTVPGASIGVNSTSNGYLRVPGNNAANGQRLSVRAGGNFEVGAGGTCPTVTLALYPVTFVGTVGTIGATAIVSYASTLQNLTGTNYPFALNAELCGDSGSGLVQILSGQILVDGTNTAATPGLVTGLTAINFANSIPFGVVMAVTFSVSESGNSATLFQFDLQQ